MSLQVEVEQEDKTFLKEAWKYSKAVVVGAMIGFALGLFLGNVSYTQRLMEDCETMKQFRIGKLAYDCKVK